MELLDLVINDLKAKQGKPYARHLLYVQLRLILKVMGYDK
jgi:hypothetical protein